MNYINDTSIDKLALDKEWLRQSDLVGKYSRIYSDAEQDYDLAKENLEVVMAELDKTIRMNKSKFDLEKITDAVVESTIKLQPEYKDAFKKMIDAKYELSMVKGALKALDHKKDALENLVRLFGIGYFSGPKAPMQIDREWEKEERQKENNAKIKMTRRPRE